MEWDGESVNTGLCAACSCVCVLTHPLHSAVRIHSAGVSQSLALRGTHPNCAAWIGIQIVTLWCDQYMLINFETAAR